MVSETQFYYLVKDMGLPTVIASGLLIIFYKFGGKVMQALIMSNEVIAKNTKIIEQHTTIISTLITKLIGMERKR